MRITHRQWGSAFSVPANNNASPVQVVILGIDSSVDLANSDTNNNDKTRRSPWQWPMAVLGTQKVHGQLQSAATGIILKVQLTAKQNFLWPSWLRWQVYETNVGSEQEFALQLYHVPPGYVAVLGQGCKMPTTYTGRQGQAQVKFHTQQISNTDAGLYTGYLASQSNQMRSVLVIWMQIMEWLMALNLQSIYSLYNNFGAYPNFYSTSTLASGDCTALMLMWKPATYDCPLNTISACRV